jgi:hypothetical protein
MALGIVRTDMRRTFLTAFGLGIAAVGSALTPLERTAAYIAMDESAKPYLSAETQMRTKASLDELTLEFKRYNDGIAEMRARKASDAERIAFAKKVRAGAEDRHAERVWKSLSADERDLMVRLACKSRGVSVLVYKEASELVGVSEEQRVAFTAKYDALAREQGEFYAAYSQEWRELINATRTEEEQEEVLERYRKIAGERGEEYQRKRAALDASVLASLSPDQKRRWAELTALPKL